jgi:hypothetical protein
MFGPSPALLVFRKLNRCLSSPLTSANSVPRTIPFRITSFADPHRLTPIESHSCKKQGGGVPPSPLATFDSSVTQQRLQVLSVHWLTSQFPSHQGAPASSWKSFLSVRCTISLTISGHSTLQVFQPSNAHAIPHYSPPLLCLLAPFLLSSAPKRENSNVR